MSPTACSSIWIWQLETNKLRKLSRHLRLYWTFLLKISFPNIRSNQSVPSPLALEQHHNMIEIWSKTWSTLFTNFIPQRKTAIILKCQEKNIYFCQPPTLEQYSLHLCSIGRDWKSKHLFIIFSLKAHLPHQEYLERWFEKSVLLLQLF